MSEEDKGQPEYLVKWCQLPYNEATWETPATIKNTAKVEQFERFNAYPPEPDKERPPKEAWVKMETSPTCVLRCIPVDLLALCLTFLSIYSRAHAQVQGRQHSAALADRGCQLDALQLVRLARSEPLRFRSHGTYCAVVQVQPPRLHSRRRNGPR